MGTMPPAMSAGQGCFITSLFCIVIVLLLMCHRAFLSIICRWLVSFHHLSFAVHNSLSRFFCYGSVAMIAVAKHLTTSLFYNFIWASVSPARFAAR